MSAAPARTQIRAWTIETSLDPGVDEATLTIRGRLGVDGAQAFRDAIHAIDSCSRLRLDLTGVDYMSSAGIAVLRDAARHLHQRSGALELAAASEHVRLALRLAGEVPHLFVTTRPQSLDRLRTED